VSLDVRMHLAQGPEPVARTEHVIRPCGIGHDDVACADGPLDGQPEARVRRPMPTLRVPGAFAK
jgi:hypothetical protein